MTFELGAVTVDPQTPSYNPRPLIGYMAALGVPYFYEEQGASKKRTSCLTFLCEILRGWVNGCIVQGGGVGWGMRVLCNLRQSVTIHIEGGRVMYTSTRRCDRVGVDEVWN